MDRALKEILRSRGLAGREAALCTRLCYGVIQNETLLDFYLAAFSRILPGKLESGILDILRLSLYQHRFLDAIPDYAHVFAAVEAARAHSGEKAAGYVNAVLRAALRAKEWPQPQGTAAQRFPVLYSRPPWQVDALLDALGETECEALLRRDNGVAGLWIQVNTQKIATSALCARLCEEDVAPKAHPFVPDCLALTGAPDLEALSSYKEGLFWAADPGAALAVSAANVQPGQCVIDACAAPGGKTFLLARAMANAGRIHAWDRHRHKMGILEKGAERLGFSCVTAAEKDASVFDAEFADAADLVVADVPCSGLGAVGKKPDIRMKREEDIARLPAIQSRILCVVSRYVKPGGKLLYITCTLLRAENEAVTDAFVQENTEFSYLPFSCPWPVGETDGRVTLWPHRQETDGFYIALLRRGKGGSAG